jgi:hypothetical protein
MELLRSHSFNIISRPRGGGKTTEAIRLAYECGATMVCHSIIEAARVKGVAKQMGLKIQDPICYSEFTKRPNVAEWGKRRPAYIIDNLEYFLSKYGDVIGFTITGKKDLK